MTESIETINTPAAPDAVGSYSQGTVVEAGRRLVFVSGQLPILPKTEDLIEGDIKTMTNQVIDNLEAVLKSCGSALNKVLRVDVFLVDLKKDFLGMNEVYSKRFVGPDFPARQTVGVSQLPKDARIEMSCIAVA